MFLSVFVENRSPYPVLKYSLKCASQDLRPNGPNPLERLTALLINKWVPGPPNPWTKMNILSNEPLSVGQALNSYMYLIYLNHTYVLNICQHTFKTCVCLSLSLYIYIEREMYLVNYILC